MRGPSPGLGKFCDLLFFIAFLLINFSKIGAACHHHPAPAEGKDGVAEGGGGPMIESIQKRMQKISNTAPIQTSLK